MTVWTSPVPAVAPRVARLAIPTSTPEDQGVASVAVSDFLDSAVEAGIDLQSIEIIRHGHEIAAGWWAPYRRDDLVLKYSLSKSFTSTCVGIVAAAGLLSVDDPVRSFFPDEYSLGAGPRARSLTIRHLLSMATGHETDTLPLLDRDDPIPSFFALEPDAVPGTLFTYNNGATYLLSAIVTAVTGDRLLDVAGPHLLAPLGIRAAHWDRAGEYDAGFSGLHVDTDAIARLGLTYLSGGEFGGARVVPARWVMEASSVQVGNADRGASVDWQQGYGFQFWRSTHGFRGDGAYGQFCLVLPDQDAVIVSTGAVEDMQSVLDLVWRILLPAFSDRPLPEAPVAAAALTDRLATVCIPLGAAGTGRREHPAGSWDLATAGAPADTLQLGTVRLAGGAADWTLTLDDGVGRYELAMAPQWTRSEHRVGDHAVLRLSSAGSWTGADEFSAQVILGNTPHRFSLRADLVSGRAELYWHTAPLEDRRLSGRALPVVAE